MSSKVQSNKVHMGHTARKRFGQNFLHDRYVIDQIVAAINPQPGQNLVEIGPGLAALTEPVWPGDLAELVALAGQPAAWPVDAGVVEESTVNAGELGRRIALEWPGFPDS